MPQRGATYACAGRILWLAFNLSDLPGGYSDDEHAPRRRDLDRGGHADRRHDQSHPQIHRALAGGRVSQSRNCLSRSAADRVRSAMAFLLLALFLKTGSAMVFPVIG